MRAIRETSTRYLLEVNGLTDEEPSTLGSVEVVHRGSNLIEIHVETDDEATQVRLEVKAR